MRYIIVLAILLLLSSCSVEKPMTNNPISHQDLELDAVDFEDDIKKSYSLDGLTNTYPHHIFGNTRLPAFLYRNGFKYDATPKVIEGNPIFGDINNDGIEETIVTVSDLLEGAQILVLDEELIQIAQSEPIGTGFRWRHVIALEKFGPNKEIEIATVKTPHIGGVVEFYQLKENQLEIVASLSGYSSHISGSPNLGMATSGDFNKDGQIELIVPTQSMKEIAGLQRTPDGIKEVYRLLLDGKLSTKIMFFDGQIIAGREDKVRIFSYN